MSGRVFKQSHRPAYLGGPELPSPPPPPVAPPPLSFVSSLVCHHVSSSVSGLSFCWVCLSVCLSSTPSVFLTGHLSLSPCRDRPIQLYFPISWGNFRLIFAPSSRPPSPSPGLGPQPHSGCGGRDTPLFPRPRCVLTTSRSALRGEGRALAPEVALASLSAFES